MVSPTSNLAVSPNNLVNQLTLAKLVEEKRHPETIDFSKQSSNYRETPKAKFIIELTAEKIGIVDNVTSPNKNETGNDLGVRLNHKRS